MKKSILHAAIGPALALSLSACGTSLEDFNLVVPEATEEAEATDEAQYLLADDDQAGVNTDSDAVVLEEATDEKGKQLKELLKGLHKQVRLEIAECAGVSAEVQALQNAREELKAAGVSRKEAREQLSDERTALKEAVQGKRAEIKACRQDARDSEAGAAIKDVITSCWEKPERRGKGPRGLKLNGADKPKQGPGRGKGKRKMFFKGEQMFDSEACIAAVESASALIEAPADSEEDTTEENSTEETSEETTESAE